MKKHKENRSRSEKRFFSDSESATATVIGAVLLLGIIFSVLTILWVGSVPEWKNDAEYSHMDDVWEDMAELKSRIDIMSIVMASGSNSSPISSNSSPISSNSSPINPLYLDPSAPKLVTSVPFHLGGGGIPLISSMKSSGTLAINKGKCVMSIIVNREGAAPYIKSIDCGTITFTSQNTQYVDQVFSYENGALILDQREQSVMMLYPSIRLSNVSTSGHNEYNVSINAISVGQRPRAPIEIISSNSECSLRLTGIDHTFDYISVNASEKKNSGNKNKDAENVNKLTLIITSNYPDAWMLHLNKTIEGAGIGPEKYKVERLTGNNVRLTFYMVNDGKKVDPDILRLYVGETVIKAEPGIGLN